MADHDSALKASGSAPSRPVSEPAVTAAALRGWPRALVRAAIMAVISPFVALRIEGLDLVPATGPFLLVANHLHNADPVLIQTALRRPVHFMAKQELFRVPLLRTIIRLVGSFPVNRERPGRAAIRQAIALLQAGIPVGMFPEGTRSRTGALGPAFAGAGLIAVESAVPIVPVSIIGTEFLPGGTRRRPAWRPGRPLRCQVTVRFGVPAPLPDSITAAPRSSAAATSYLMSRLAALLPPAYHGVSHADSPLIPAPVDD